MCLSIQIDPFKFITDTWAALSRPVGYLLDPQPRITRLIDAMNQLRCQSEDIQNIIISAELAGEKPTHQIRHWFTKVDAIDAKVSKIQTDHENGSFRWCINRRAAHTLADVTALGKNFVFDMVATKLPPNRVKEVPVVLPRATITLVSYLSQLQEFLKDDGSRIIGIWGMGGVGKTTLLGTLNDELRCSSEAGQSPPMFDHVIWAVASKDYKLWMLQRDIAKWLGLPIRKERDRQAMEIMNFLRNKSFLLLLDDLWEPVDFAELGIPQVFRSGATKQKVVFTTRLEGVCGQMQAQQKLKIECLNDEEAWQLFQEKVGEETLQAHVMIPRHARRVAKECDGLPLALVVIGSAMSTKRTPKEWLNAITLLQKSRPHEIHGKDGNILPKLKFSYDNLADEIFRKCFLLCSLWPEDHSISKTDLIQCWMGHGLIDERKFDNINEAYDSGHALIGGLQAACLLELGDNKEREVKMHDVVRDLAFWIASDCGEKPNRFIVRSSVFASDDMQGEVETISFVRSNLSDTSGLPANCTKLKTLMVRESISFKSIVSGFFEGTRSLTYLDISYTAIYDLPQDIGLLRNLRYLNLSHTNIHSLPWQLGYLRELRFLLLRKLESIDIPRGVLEKLVMLSLIDMSDTWCQNWQELSWIRRCLKGIGIVLESIQDLHQLAQFTNVLTWRLGLRKLLLFNEPLKLLSAFQLGSRSIRSSIQMLKIEFCERLKVISMESDGDGGIQEWCLPRLEEVELRSLPELKEILWRRVCPAEMLPSLTVLMISGCHKLSNISWVIRLPSLEDLTVHHCNEMKQIIDDTEFVRDSEEGTVVSIADWTFPSLRRLRLKELRNLRAFGGSFTFSSLEVLQVIHCPGMKRLPFGAEKTGRKLKEISCERKWWEELDLEDDVRGVLQPCLRETY